MSQAAKRFKENNQNMHVKGMNPKVFWKHVHNTKSQKGTGLFKDWVIPLGANYLYAQAALKTGQLISAVGNVFDQKDKARFLKNHLKYAFSQKQMINDPLQMAVFTTLVQKATPGDSVKSLQKDVTGDNLRDEGASFYRAMSTRLKSIDLTSFFSPRNTTSSMNPIVASAAETPSVNAIRITDV